MSEGNAKISYDMRPNEYLLLLLLAGIMNFLSDRTFSSFLLGIGYGVLVYLILFLLSLIPIIGQTILWFLVIPWAKSVFIISSPQMFIFDIIILCYSIYYSILAIFMYTAVRVNRRESTYHA